MEKESEKKVGRGDERRERIKNEILKAKREAGLDPPAEIPIGERFRVESLSRPAGAVSIELDLQSVVRGDLNADFLESYGDPDGRRLLKQLSGPLGLDRAALLGKVEQALDRLSGPGVARLAGAISDQLNLAASVAPGDEGVAKLRARLDELRFGPVDYSDGDKERLGGGQKRGGNDSRGR